MADAMDIKDGESLRAWLEGRPREVAVSVAARAALRVAPLQWSSLARLPRRDDFTELAICRPLVIAGVAAVRPTPAIRAAAAAATDSAVNPAAVYAAVAAAFPAANATYAANAAVGAAIAAANAVIDTLGPAIAAAIGAAIGPAIVTPDNSLAARLAMWSESRADCLELERRADPMRRPLWTGGPPGWLPAPLPYLA